jgi:GT2 family glycosyltransferase
LKIFGDKWQALFMKINDILSTSEIDSVNLDMKPRVAIVILNWNGWLDTIECLESVYQMGYPNFDVIVVDNGSENDSVKKIREYADGKIPVKSPFFTYNMDNKPINYIEYTRQEIEKIKEHPSDIPPPQRLIIIKNESLNLEILICQDQEH